MNNKYEQYLRLVNTFPIDTEVKLTDLLEILEEYSIQEIKSDFNSIGIKITSNKFNAKQAKWILRNYINQHNSDETSISIEIPSKDQYAKLANDIYESNLLKAAIRDDAFKYFEKNPDDNLLSLSLLAGNEVAFKHQIQTVNNVFNNLYNRCIVADEVGLGKTITALLWLHEHFIRGGRGLNALILVPANLLKQWTNALSKFFLLPFSPNKTYTINELETQDILLISIDKAKIGNISKILINRYWDCIILDESHIIKDLSTQRFKFVYSLNASYKLFLTATPVHNSAYDLYSQSLPLFPGLLGQKKQFGEYYLEDDKRVRNPEGLQNVIKTIFTRTRRKDIPFKFTKRISHTETLKEWTNDEYNLYDDLLRILVGVFHKQLPKAIYLSHQQGGEIAVAEFVLLSMLLFREMASHPCAALNTIENSLLPSIEEYATATKDYTYKNLLINFLDKYNRHKYDLSKKNYLIELLNNLFKKGSRRVIIFVNYLKTREAIKAIIEEKFPHLNIFEYYGDLTHDEKYQAEQNFKSSDKAILISTDAGGQGLNLQAADVVINYDYPWNPMVVEQRIGRIDRLDSKYSRIYIYNLITFGTIEQYVYQTLLEKINIVKDVIGDIMSPIEIKEEWERRFTISIGLIVLSCENSSELKDKFQKLDKTSLSSAASQYKSLIYHRYNYD